MIKLKTPHGLSVNVPEIKSEDPSPKFSIEDIEIIKDYYFENGYVIIKNLFAKQQCKEVMKLWDEEIKKFNGYIFEFEYYWMWGNNDP